MDRAGTDGGCRCGEVRYSLAIEAEPPVYCCHCLYCQTWSGTAFTQQAVVPEAAIQVTRGKPALYERINDNGATSRQSVCGTCHTRLWNTNSARPGLAVVRAGSLEGSEHVVPRAHIWTKRKQPWVVLDPQVPAWPENAPPAEFAAALSVAR